MINVNEYLTELTRNTDYVTIRKQNYNDRIAIHFSYPLSKIGFDDVALTRMKTILASNWSLTEREIQQLILDYLDSHIIPNYVDILRQLAPRNNLPAIIIAMLCQRINSIDPKIIGTNAVVFTDESEYIYEVALMTQVPIFTNTFNGILKLDRVKGISNIKTESSISTIMWKVPYTENAYLQYGVRHVWDHWNYEHFHVVSTFEEHKQLILNGVKRTWVAVLKYLASTPKYHSRINYGYGNNLSYPPWIISQRKILAKLQLGTIYTPPGELKQVEEMTLEQVELYILSSQPNLPSEPCLLKIFITPEQLEMELALGNIVVQDRVRVMPQFDPLYQASLVDEIVLDRLPRGPSFDPVSLAQTLTMRVMERHIVRMPKHELTTFGWNKLSSFSQQVFGVTLYDVIYKLNELRAITSKNLTTTNLLGLVSNNGINIDLGSIGQRSMLLAGLSAPDLNGQKPIVNLNTDFKDRAFLSLNKDGFVPDYFIGKTVIDEIFQYLLMVQRPFVDLGLSILNSQIPLPTFQQIMHDSSVRVTYHTTNDGYGTSVLQLFGVLNNNEVQYYNFYESDWLTKSEDIIKLLTTISEANLYSFEFTNFSPSILLECLKQFNSILTLLNKNLFVRLLPPILNDAKGVGIRMLIHQHTEFVNMFTDITEAMLRPYTMSSTFLENSATSFVSKVWDRDIVPCAGTSLIIETTEDILQPLLGYATSLSTHVACRAYNPQHPFTRIGCVVSRERIATLDRLKMFREYQDISNIKLRLRSTPTTFNLVNGTSIFELVTQIDRQLLYEMRKRQNLLGNALSDYGSGPLLNIFQTDRDYIMYDQVDYGDIDVPGVIVHQVVLPITTPLPYVENSDVLIYNSLFFNQAFEDVDIVSAMKVMLSGVVSAQNLYFNFPYMDEELALILAPLRVVSIKDDNYYIKLGSYPPVRCLTNSQYTEILNYLTSQLYHVTVIQPTFLDYIETSILDRRYAVAQDYYSSIQLHLALPFLVCSKTTN